MQSSKIDVPLLPVYTFFGMEIWNGIWKKILVWNEICNGRLLVWNGNVMDENCHYGIRKNRLPFHAMPWQQHKSNKIAYKVNLPAFFFKLNAISCFILSRDVEAVKFLWKRKHFDEKDWKRKRTRKRLALSGAGSGSKKFQR